MAIPHAEIFQSKYRPDYEFEKKNFILIFELRLKIISIHEPNNSRSKILVKNHNFLDKK